MDDCQGIAYEGRLAAQQGPERHAQTVDVRAGIDALLTGGVRELLGTGKGRCAHEGVARVVGPEHIVVGTHRLGQAPVDHLDVQRRLGLQRAHQHQVAGLEVAVYQPMRLRRRQGAGHLHAHFQDFLGRQGTATLHPFG